MKQTHACVALKDHHQISCQLWGGVYKNKTV